MKKNLFTNTPLHIMQRGPGTVIRTVKMFFEDTVDQILKDVQMPFKYRICLTARYLSDCVRLAASDSGPNCSALPECSGTINSVVLTYFCQLIVC